MENIAELSPNNLQSNKISKRDPAIAVVLGFFILGAGQIYSGYLKRGLLFIGIFLLLTFTALSMVFQSFTITLIAYGVYFLFWIFVLVDAYKCAKKQNPNYELKWFNRWYIYLGAYAAAIFGGTIIGICLKIFAVEAFKIPTGSMENTILVNDYIIADKTAYWFNTPQRNDLAVFLYPGDRDEYSHEEEINYIKRIIGLPGETIKIINKAVYVNDNLISNPPGAMFDGKSRPTGLSDYRIFPKGSGWNEDNYGPIAVPKKGDNIQINDINLDVWKVFIYRDSDLQNKGELDALINKMLNGDSLYTVKKNYYFMMGDNRNNSADSRYWGFLPEENITGKVSYVYFSFDDELYNIRWDRIGKEIK